MFVGPLMLATLIVVAFAPTAAADDDPPLADCERILFLHWIDYSRHYACIDQDGDIQDGECTVGYKRDAPQASSQTCFV